MLLQSKNVDRLLQYKVSIQLTIILLIIPLLQTICNPIEYNEVDNQITKGMTKYLIN